MSTQHDPHAPLTEGHYDAAVSQVQQAIAPKTGARGVGAAPGAEVPEDTIRRLLVGTVNTLHDHHVEAEAAGQPVGKFDWKNALQIAIKVVPQILAILGPLFAADQGGA